MSIKIALAGNPNSGKTTLFNHLTGSRQHVGNWPGVTVEKKEGTLKSNKEVTIQDLPGIYSLSPYSLEEVVARNYLVHERPDAILNIVDATNIERNLYLTTQLLELGIPVVVALNMMDLVERNGDQINVDQLSKLLGCKGTTGTQASFLELFEGDHQKCRQLDEKIAQKMGYDKCFPVSGQTYSRKLDSQMLNLLSGIAQSAAKFSNDIRLLQHLKEVEEPFEKGQIGSSAMAYKRNPMRSERIASLARYVMADALNPALTMATQWFERTLDDSANKRISVPEAFLAVDGILNLYNNVADGLVVYPKVIEQHMLRELPFMATENIMMDAVKRGGNRQELHERIRVHSMAAARVVKEEGGENDLLSRIAADPIFGVTLEELEAVLEPSKYVGRAPRQTQDFLNEVVAPVLERYRDVAEEAVEINV